MGRGGGGVIFLGADDLGRAKIFWIYIFFGDLNFGGENILSPFFGILPALSPVINDHSLTLVSGV